ncbi:hypothetical protein EB151_13055, partial [archaeon]|nr:hypothetical protein [archaeon]
RRSGEAQNQIKFGDVAFDSHSGTLMTDLGKEKLLQELDWIGNVKFLLLMMIYMFGQPMNIRGKSYF